MQVLVTKLVNRELAGRANHQIVTVAVCSGVEDIRRRQELGYDQKLAVEERSRGDSKVTVCRQNDLIDGWPVLEHDLIDASAVAAPDGLDLGRRVKFLDQLQEFPNREGIWR